MSTDISAACSGHHSLLCQVSAFSLSEVLLPSLLAPPHPSLSERYPFITTYASFQAALKTVQLLL